jgi:4-hydroxy-tetrahydrodipicolinate reductase
MATRIGIVGAEGRMGRMLLAAIAATTGRIIAGGTERPGNPALGPSLPVHDEAARGALAPPY